MPVPEMSHILPWVADHPLWFTRSLGVIDIAGGIGILLPSLFRRVPKLIRYAAIGCASKQVVAIVYHLTQGEPGIVPLNIVLLTLSLFIIWSRTDAGKALFGNRSIGRSASA
ncbi:DoxX family protein [Marinobacterium sp. YM272]|uniref:DoxX family protein n=1 Tax=Marinobacterium sp. YM272 TaxID=3421654 RepID=UPI003D7F1A91